VDSLLSGGTREVELTTRIPVHMTYFTAMVDRQGNLRTFGDLYGLDTRMGAILFGKKVPFVTPRYDDEIRALRARRGPADPSGAPTRSTLAEAISNIFSPWPQSGRWREPPFCLGVGGPLTCPPHECGLARTWRDPPWWCTAACSLRCWGQSHAELPTVESVEGLHEVQNDTFVTSATPWLIVRWNYEIPEDMKQKYHANLTPRF